MSDSGNLSPGLSELGELSPVSAIRSSPSPVEDLKSIDDIIDELVEEGVIEDNELKYFPENDIITYKDSAGTQYFVKVGKTNVKKVLVEHENDIYDIIDTFSEEEKEYFIHRTGSGLEDDYSYCILEYIEGKTLYEYIADMQAGRTAPSVRELHSLLYHITKGLDILLRHGIVHGDLKSQNIILTGNPPIKIFDFELSAELVSYADLQKNLSATYQNPSHGYIYIATVLAKDMAHTIRSICETPSEGMYARILKVIEGGMQVAGERKRRRRGTKRGRAKKVRWSRRVSSRYAKGD